MSITLLQPYDYDRSTCGYCSAPGERSSRKTSYSYGLIAQQMSPKYTIRLDAGAFKPTRQQRSAVNRWNRFLSTGLRPGETEADADMAAGGPEGEGKGKGKNGGKGKNEGKSKGKGKSKPFELVPELRAWQEGHASEPGKHTFKLEFIPAKCTDETYALYRKYQMSVHHDKPGKVTRQGFSRFLCDSPLGDVPIPYTPGANTSNLPQHYGSYHLLYRVDGELVGISVIDILPVCVSSVYFIWDPEWAWAGLGKLSALYEIALVRDMDAAGAPGMKWLYMGYWIATCQKMRYKGEYAPSYLLDPGTNAFHALTPKLDRYLQAHGGYTPFADIEAGPETEVVAPLRAGADMSGDVDMSGRGVRRVRNGESKSNQDSNADSGPDSDPHTDSDSDPDSDSDSDTSFPTPPPPGFADPSALPTALVHSLVVLNIDGGKAALVPYGIYRRNLRPWVTERVRQMVAALGVECLATVGGEIRDKGVLFFG